MYVVICWFFIIIPSLISMIQLIGIKFASIQIFLNYIEVGTQFLIYIKFRVAFN